MLRFIDLSTLGIQILCIGANVLPGVLNLWRHKWGAAAINFGAAVIIVGMNIFLYWVRKRQQRLFNEIERTLQEQIGTFMGYYPASVLSYADENLAKVIKAVHARKRGEAFTIRVGRTKFTVRSGTISKNLGWFTQKSTCYQMSAGIPEQEKIASALLLLRNDPKIFDRWRKDHGCWYV